jgi:hypothetical protein
MAFFTPGKANLTGTKEKARRKPGLFFLAIGKSFSFKVT